MWLTPSHSTHYLHTLYLAWSFVHLLGRVLLVSLNAAKVHEEIQTFERVVQDCPNEKYSIEVSKICLHVNKPPPPHRKVKYKCTYKKSSVSLKIKELTN